MMFLAMSKRWIVVDVVQGTFHPRVAPAVADEIVADFIKEGSVLNVERKFFQLFH